MHRDWSVDFTDFQWKTLDSETQANTFIEWCFEQKCFGLSQGNDLKNEWRSRKADYIKHLKSTVFDFQHFSRHDDTHSINILNAIELVLGRNRVKLLSTSDLWLLLESAYFHDIGMALSDAEIRNIWTSDEFRTYLLEALVANDIDAKCAANYYLQMDNILNGRKKLSDLDNQKEIEFLAEWPIDLKRNINILTAAYIRGKHPQRSKAFMEEQSDDTTSHVIKNRMDRLVGLISELHGMDFSDIRKVVVYQDLGFDTEYLHPQFVAAMLRLGDLLDMDNNRFNVRAIKHFGRLPILSQYHYEKHRAICHFSVTPERIEAQAVSNDDHVCQEVSKWFQWLDEEVKNLSCDWNDFAPLGLKGCTLRRCTLEVKFGDSAYNTKFHKNFQVDQARLISLMAGSNIYNSKLDCFREYLQNALDATKMRLWLDETNGKSSKASKKMTPFDIPKERYEEKAIEIEVSVLPKDSAMYVSLAIKDQGVGMESSCVDGLSIVGRGWKQRDLYQNEILKMPEWLKPTGGFGIGLQSAFMLTDHVSIFTRSIKESMGFQVELDAPREGGGIIKRQNEQYTPGTTVKIQIPLDTFYELIRDIKQLELEEHKELELHFNPPDGDIFSERYSEEYICAFFEYYLKEQIPSPLFPIRITNGKHSYTYRSPYASKMGGFGPLEKTFILQDRYLCSVSEDLTVRIWDQAEHIFVCVMSWPTVIHDFSPEKGRLLNHFCYRNIKVQNVKEKDLGLRYQNFLSVCMDVMNHQTEDILSLRRNDFIPEFNLAHYYQNYLSVYVEAIYTCSNKEDISRHLDIYRYALLAIQVLSQEKLGRVLKAFQDKAGVSGRMVRTVDQKKHTIQAEYLDTGTVINKISSIFTQKHGNDRHKQPQSIFIVAREPLPHINSIPMCSLQNIKDIEDRELQSCISELNGDALIYADPDVCQALSHVGSRFRMIYFCISEDTDHLIYAAIKGLNEDWNYESSVELAKEEFLKKAFWANAGSRYMGENVDCPRYNSLQVTHLPARQRIMAYEHRSKTYIISPISSKIFNKLLLALDINGMAVSQKSIDLEEKIRENHTLLPKEKFIALITAEEDYLFLISWVHQHQRPDTKRLDLKEISDTYKQMLEDIYDLFFDAGGFQDE